MLTLMVLLLAVFPSDGSLPPPHSPSVWSGPHIADLNVLLPPKMTNYVHYRLLGTGGCFTWSWDHHDILSVQPEINGTAGCSTSARLTSIASYSGRKETAVYATEISSGSVIRCEVFIDKITRIQIFHHSVKLDIGGLSTLQIRAFDDNENVFSSLVGLQFNWNLMPQSIESDNHLLHIPLNETPLSDCGGFCGDLETQIQLEDNGVGSDLYVVRGIEIGHEIVTAHLFEPQSEHLMDKIVLTVVELMSLDPPSPIFVINGALIQYRLIVIRHNTPIAIDLPSLYHQWSISNSTVAKVDASMGTVTMFNLGTVSVVVEDTRVAGHKQISVVYVVAPDRLALYIVPVITSFDPSEEIRNSNSYPWYVIAGQTYVVHMKAFSAAPEEWELYLTESDKLNLESDNSVFFGTSVLPNDVVTKHGWRNTRYLKPKVEGNGTLMASLNYHRGDPEIVEVLKVYQEVIVCNKVTIHIRGKNLSFETISLPWAPQIHQELELTAIGGCAKGLKDYSWFSSNQLVVSVSTSGIIQANHPGRTVIKVCSIFDITNYAEVVVDVSIPSSMVMVSYFSVEAIVGTHLYAAVSLNAPNGNYYQKCDSFSSSVSWSVLSGKGCFKVANMTDPLPFDLPLNAELSDTIHHLCAWTYLDTYCPAQAMLHAVFSSEKHSFDHHSEEQIILHAFTPVATYTPLFAKQVSNGNQFGGYWVDLVNTQQIGAHDSYLESLGELYLVPGTSIDINIFGGPERWDEGVEFIDTVRIYGEENQFLSEEIVVKHPSEKDGNFYTVFCQTIGHYKLAFSRGNLIGKGHPQKAVENLELTLLCSLPSFITLIAIEHANTLDAIQSSIHAVRGPGNVHNSFISVANGHTIRVAAVGIHNSGRPFANSSSMYLNWDLIGCDYLSHWDENANVANSVTSWERFLSLHNESGLCIVRATVAGFSHNNIFISEEELVFFESKESNLTDALKLQLVSALAIIPESVLLVPEAKVNMSVTGGTCFLEAAVNDTRVVEILHHPGTTPCSWLSLGSRGVGSALLTIYDNGLSPPSAVTAKVKVSYVEWIKLISQEDIFMLKGTTKHFEISAGTRDGSAFEFSQYMYMNIHVHFNESLFKLINVDDQQRSGIWSIYQPIFSIKAENLGYSSIYVSIAGESGSRIVSERIMVEVYPVLTIYPPYVFLSPGASYMVTVEGGPTVGVMLEFSSLDDEIATIHGYSGRLFAKSIGNTTLRVSCSINGVLVCDAYGRVEVEIPPMMFLSMQSEHLCVGCAMSTFPSYPEGNLFSFYEVCNNFMWIVENSKILGISSSGLSYPNVVMPHSFGSREKSSYISKGDDDIGFINVVHGRSAGRSKIFVSFSCEFILTGGHVSRSYNASHTIRVVSEPPLALGIPITWVLPPFYTTSDILPESSGFFELDSHRKNERSISYSLLKSSERNVFTLEDGISIAGSKIKTKESNNLDCLLAKEKSGRMEIACCVRVAEVVQVRVTKKENLVNVFHLAVNDKVEMLINYCDGIGYPFFEAHGAVSLDIKTNYHDVVSVHLPSETDSWNYSKGIAYVQAHSQGKALVKISIKNDPRKAAYVLILVGPQIVPRNPSLHVGDFLNFSIVGGGGNNLIPGHWSSSNESVISISKISGEARAHAEGNSQVHYKNSNTTLQSTVAVLRNKQILVHAPLETLTNVPFPYEGYKFSVWLSDSLDYMLRSTGTSFEATYDCRVIPSYIGYAKPWTDHVNGVSYCLFFPYSPEHLVSFASKLKSTSAELTNGAGGQIYLSIIASLKEAQHIMGSARSLFVGGFSISTEDMLNFSPDFNRSLVTIVGNTDVQMDWNAKHLMVRPIFEERFGIVAQTQFEIFAYEYQKFSEKITFAVPQTGQKLELAVNYNPGKQTPITLTSTRTLILVVVVSLFLLIPTVVAFIRVLDRPDTYGPSRPQVQAPAPPSASSSAPITPDCTSIAGSQSPITPPPFIEYVRKTLDETPYYKRGSRRFNSQYTY